MVATTYSPTANPGTQQWTSPANGFSSNDLYATSAVNGNLSEYGTYGIAQVGDESQIDLVEVGIEGKTAGDDDVRVEFSTDGGGTWTIAGTFNPGAADTTVFFDVTALRTWTFALLSNANFRTRIAYVQVGTMAATNSADWVPVRVTTSAPPPPGGAAPYRRRRGAPWGHH